MGSSPTSPMPRRGPDHYVPFAGSVNIQFACGGSDPRANRIRSASRSTSVSSRTIPHWGLPMSIQGKRVAVLVEKFYEDLELWYPVLRLREAGCDVKSSGRRRGRRTLRSTATRQGRRLGRRSEGRGLRRHRHPRRLLARPHAAPQSDGRPRDRGRQAGKVLAAICHGPWMLCSAGCLKGKKVTGFFVDPRRRRERRRRSGKTPRASATATSSPAARPTTCPPS